MEVAHFWVKSRVKIFTHLVISKKYFLSNLQAIEFLGNNNILFIIQFALITEM